PWSLLLAFVESQQGHVGHLHHLETNTRNVTHGVTFTSKTCHQNLVVLLKDADSENKFRQAEQVSLYSHFLKDDSFGVRGSSEGVSLEGSAQMGLLVLFIVPFLLTTVVTELPGGTQTTTLSWKTQTHQK
uniref:Uncharacterized protein n=1 Tax=Anabas testudineus TaxID=64144 RepID=A0AAQ6IVX6_ANATE